ncbi:Hypothetical predicted protein [Marmota monax]|uniref:Uncharacterized protein n=1 Tax=Marmota monax TaxID=9995 RepID=A0A5E4ADM7_MARMO|nr:Hypothetical predicted protein [Marmota monax]
MLASAVHSVYTSPVCTFPTTTMEDTDSDALNKDVHEGVASSTSPQPYAQEWKR